MFRRAGLNPPDEAEAVGRDVRRREALTYLVGAGTVIRAVDRVQRRAVLFHKEALLSARTRLSEAFPHACTPETGFLAREAGATLESRGNSRSRCWSISTPRGSPAGPATGG